MTNMLSESLVACILDTFGVTDAGTADIDLLERLIAGYTHTIPWESASRIARRAVTVNTADCPRFPDEFFRVALQHGTGGTCFESNYAFYALLNALGYTTALHINDMGSTVGCHTALSVHLAGERWLVDVGMPLFAPLKIDPTMPTRAENPILNYTLTPLGDQRYQVDRDPHPAPYAFTFIDRPVKESDYRAATTRDYDEGGIFLDEVLVNKLVVGQLVRFNGSVFPYRLERFDQGVRFDTVFEAETPEQTDALAAAQIAAQFNMDHEIVTAAFAALARRSLSDPGADGT